MAETVIRAGDYINAEDQPIGAGKCSTRIAWNESDIADRSGENPYTDSTEKSRMPPMDQGKILCADVAERIGCHG
jgi:hypothetical protein